MDSCGPQRETQFRQLIDACIDQVARNNGDRPPQPYNQSLLVRQFYERMQTSDNLRQRFLDAFFEHVTVSNTSHNDQAAHVTDATHVAVNAFADALVDKLFLPLKAVGSRYGKAENSKLTQVPDRPETTIYIFPPSPLTEVDEDGDLSPAGESAAEMLNMLDPRAMDLLTKGGDANTISLNPLDINAFCHFELGKYGTAAGEVSPLLTLHRTISQLLQETGAGAHINSILADTKVEDLQTDGTSHLGRLMQLRLDGWWDGGGQRTQDWWIDDGEFTEE